MSMIENEQTKVTAAAFNTVATSCVTVGVLAPLAAALYNFGQSRVSVPALGLGIAIWLGAASIIHYNARVHLRRLKP